MKTKLLLSIFLMLSSLSNWAQIDAITYNFNSPSGIGSSAGWTGNITRTAVNTACGSPSMRRNLYMSTIFQTGNMVSPGLTGNNTSPVTVSYNYKAANYISSNTVGTNPWGYFNVQFGFSANGPWTTFATVSQETQNGECITQTHTFTPPAGATMFFKWDCFWSSGDYYINFDDVSISQECFGTLAPGNTLSSTNPLCQTATTTLSLQNSNLGTGVSYQWQFSPDGIAPYSDIVDATFPSYEASPSISTFYRCEVSCNGNSITSIPLQININAVINCYCVSGASNAADTELFNVTIGALNNTSNCITPATGLGSVLNRYANYSNLPPVSIDKMVPISFSVNHGTCSISYYTRAFKIFIDGNQDGDFFDAGEEVYVSPFSVIEIGPVSTTGTISIPGSFLDGNTGMRVVLQETSELATIAPCGAYAWGETEDYIINLTTPPFCNITPPASTTQSTSISVCSGENYTLSLSNSYALIGYTFQWQSSQDSIVSYADINGATNATYTTNQTTSTFYRCRINCLYGGNQIISEPLLVSNLSNFIENEQITACNTYTWNGNTYTQSGTQTWTGSNAAGCDSVVTLNLTITPNPSVSFSPDNTAFCNNSGSVDLIGGIPLGGVYSGAGVIDGSFNPATAGSGLHPITYTYTDENGCNNATSAVFEVAVCTGVETFVQPELEVRPNPIESSTLISLKNYVGSDSQFNLLLMDATGRKVFEKRISAEVIREGYLLHIPELASGTYVFILNNSNYTSVKRLVK